MDNKKNLYDILRERFGGYEKEPSDAVWKKISGRIDSNRNPLSFYKKPLFIASTAVILILSTFLVKYYVGNNKQDHTAKVEQPGRDKTINEKIAAENKPVNPNIMNNSIIQTKPEAAKPQTDITSVKKEADKKQAGDVKSLSNNKQIKEKARITEKKNLAEQNFKEEKLTNKDEINREQIETGNNELEISVRISKKDSAKALAKKEDTLIQAEPIILNPEITSTEAKTENKEPVIAEKEKEKPLIPDTKIALNEKETPNEQAATNQDKSLQDKLPEFKKDSTQTKEQNIRVKPSLLLGLNYYPEYFISKSPLFSNKEDYSNSTDISMTLVYNKFQIRTGFGISFYNKDNWNYSVNYSKYEPIGKYLSIDSTTSAPAYDPITHDTINNKVYYINDKTYYDYATHSYKSEYIKNYYYFTFPLVLGYRFADYNRLSLTFNAGITLSVLYSTKVEELTYPDNNSPVYIVQLNEAKRVSNYWTYLFNIGLNYKVNNLISLNFEPTYKSAFGTLYYTSNVRIKKPYTIGLRAGVNIKLK